MITFSIKIGNLELRSSLNDKAEIVEWFKEGHCWVVAIFSANEERDLNVLMSRVKNVHTSDFMYLTKIGYKLLTDSDSSKNE